MRLIHVLLLVFAAAASTATPTKAVDSTWGVLARSTHLKGSWRITLDNGTRLGGDWIVVNKEQFVARDFGGGGGPAKAIYFVDSASTSVCAFDADKPFYLYCLDRDVASARIPQTATLSLTRGTTPLLTYQRAGTAFTFEIGGSVEVDVKPAKPSLDQERMLFERTIGSTLEARLGATARREKHVLVLEMPYRDEVPISPYVSNSHRVLYSQQVIEAKATIRIGRSREQVSITSEETARYVEDCVAPSPMLSAPWRTVCTRRAP